MSIRRGKYERLAERVLGAEFVAAALPCLVGTAQAPGEPVRIGSFEIRRWNSCGFRNSCELRCPVLRVFHEHRVIDFYVRRLHSRRRNANDREMCAYALVIISVMEPEIRAAIDNRETCFHLASVPQHSW